MSQLQHATIQILNLQLQPIAELKLEGSSLLRNGYDVG